MKLSKRQLKRIIREEHRRLQEAGHYDSDASERAEMEIGWLEELVYKEMDIVGAIRGHANRSQLAGRFYSAMIAVAEAKGDTLLVELLKAAQASSMPSKYMD